MMSRSTWKKRSEVIHTIVIFFKYSRISELRVPWGNKGIYKSEISVTLKLQAYLTKLVLLW